MSELAVWLIEEAQYSQVDSRFVKQISTLHEK